MRTKIHSGKTWEELETGIEKAIFRTRSCPDGFPLGEYIRKKVEKGEARDAKK
jgi:hypothetical protein